MTAGEPDTDQTMQRVRVGMTGLASVLVIIGLASAIFTSANREQPVEAVGASKEETVANMTGLVPANASAEKPKDDPLAELGVAPSTADQGNSATAPVDTPETAPQPAN